MSADARTATVTVDPAFRIGPVPRGIFGSFVEHMGRCVYGGIFEPGHPSADQAGFRGDVADLVRELGVTTVRYPGGNFLSGYDWVDGIGPVADRPARLDRAWMTIEPNTVGTDEFLQWAERVGVEPVMAVNLGTGGIQQACDLLEYVNLPGGTLWADRRVKNGRTEPYGVHRWCLGNEMDGPWQIGHKTAEEYGRLAAEVARAMRRVDPNIELIVAGSSNSAMPTFGSWEAAVLDRCHDLVDHVSVHAYYDQPGDDRTSFLASAVDMDHIIESVVATADAAAARARSRRRLRIAFDEWNVWYQHRFGGESSLGYGRSPELIEDDYSAVDAVVVGSLLISLLRHADRVDLACLAQLVNVIAPIRTEPGGSAWRQATFWPFAATAQTARGDVMLTAVESPRHVTERYGLVDTVQSVATLHDVDGAMTVLLVNRSPDLVVSTRLCLRGLGALSGVAAQHIADDGVGMSNSASDLERLRLLPGPTVRPDGRDLTIDLLPASWTLITGVASER